MIERVEKQFEIFPERLSLDGFNAMLARGEIIEADFVFGLPEFKPEAIIPSAHDWSYYSFEEDTVLRQFAESFLNTISPSAKTKESIESSTKYVLEHMSWIGTENTRSISDLVKNGEGSCTSKSVLLAYLMHKMGLRSYVIAGYARNVEIGDFPELKTRNGAYKRNSGYQQNLFNLPLESEDKSIDEDVGHAWVGVQTKDGMVYADPTTGLVSTTPEERKVFSENYKILPIAHPDFIDGVEMTDERQHNYLDLDFKEPVQKIRAKVSGAIPDEWKDGSVLVLEGPDNEEIKLKSELLGFDVINRSKI